MTRNRRQNTNDNARRYRETATAGGFLYGRLLADPELSEHGDYVFCNFRMMAQDEVGGEAVRRVAIISRLPNDDRLTTADRFADFVRKGHRILIPSPQPRLNADGEYEAFVDKDGNARSIPEFTARSFILVETKAEADRIDSRGSDDGGGGGRRRGGGSGSGRSAGDDLPDDEDYEV